MIILVGKQITLVHGGETLMNNSQTTPSAIKYCEEYLKKQGVRILLDELVVKQEGNIFTTNKGTAIEADTAFLCTGIKPNNQLLKNSFSGMLYFKTLLTRVTQAVLTLKALLWLTNSYS